MPRYALKVEYHGKPFVGWQRQKGLISVQGCIEAALLNLQSSHTDVQGAGRTDSGVHALGQIAHMDMDVCWDPFRLSEAINHHLKPHPIVITDASAVADDFHARFCAVERSYLYRIVVRRARLALDDGALWQVRTPLNIAAMRLGAKSLLGRHDFTTFRSSFCQANSPVRTLDDISIAQNSYPGGTEYRIIARARSFLHNQVRSLVGTLVQVGTGSWHPNDVGIALAARDRAACGTVAPPYGLYLTEVKYAKNPFAEN